MSRLGRAGLVILVVLAMSLSVPPVLAHEPTEPTGAERAGLDTALDRVKLIWTNAQSVIRDLETRKAAISREEAWVLLNYLDHIIEALDAVAAEAKTLTSSHIPWYRVMQFDAERASLFFRTAHRLVYDLGEEYQPARPVTRVQPLAKSDAEYLHRWVQGAIKYTESLLEIEVKYNSCFPFWFRLRDGTCWKPPMFP